MDGALEIGGQVTWRVLYVWATPSEAAPKLTERVRTALRELLKPRRPDDETGRFPTPEEFKEVLERFPKGFLATLGRSDYWTVERAASRLVPGLILRAVPMIATGGQTPGRALLNLRVVSVAGQPITARQALVREFGPILLFFGLDLLPLKPAARGTAKLILHFTAAARLVDPRRGSFPDLLAGTRIVRTA